jgi:diaminopimelate epimerase
MKFQFTKMHGLGNDFVVIDTINQAIDLNSEQFAFIADRKLGIGCDQILLVERSDTPNALFRYRIFNADGGEVEQCGNGARCFALFVRQQGLTDTNEIPVITNSGLITLHIIGDDQVRVDMGIPQLLPDNIPFHADKQQAVYTLEYEQQAIQLSAVSMGNPHAVIVVNTIATAPVTTLGAAIESHSSFPQRVNVGFMQVINRNHIQLRVFERGVGETRACGTGACAAAIAGQLRNLLDQHVTVTLPGGILSIEWQGKNSPVMMTGPAQTVFTGSITL